jgi:hypothetical protein
MPKAQKDYEKYRDYYIDYNKKYREEHREYYLNYGRKYREEYENKKQIYCDVCDCGVSFHNFARHCKSSKHLINLNFKADVKKIKENQESRRNGQNE